MKIPMIAMRGMTVFPHMLIHFDIGRAKSIRALDEAMKNNQVVFLVAQKDMKTEDPEEQDVFEIGTISYIRQMLKLPGGVVRVLVEGHSRAKLLGLTQSEPFQIAEVLILTTEAAAKPRTATQNRMEALTRRIKELLETYITISPKVSPEILMNVISSSDPSYLCDYIMQNLPMPHEKKQMILEEIHPFSRMEKLIAMLINENEILQIEADIQIKLHDQINKNQKDYYLREQIKTIQNELGEPDDVMSEADNYIDKIRKLQLPEETAKKFASEASRLRKMNYSSPESSVIRGYLDIALELPWNAFTKDRLDIAAAKRMLDKDHYGLQKVKERILEFLAVKKLAPELKGQILCLVGPPGVGKTSIAISIARALNRNYARLSLGGVRDESEIRGHRKTYIGAMPGRIINAVKQASSKNAMILLDEIDKLGSDFRGDPSAALLEVLDPEQNSTFRDHYLEVPFDLSEILFITTANATDTIPRPLLDRMEIIELTSYTDEEKLQIAKKYLVPKQLERHGLVPNKKPSLKFTDGAIRELINGYTRESGVRTLEREMAAVCRKIAKANVEENNEVVAVKTLKEQDLVTILGIRRFKPERRRKANDVGVANGLAWTRVGGEILEVEVNVVEGTGKVELTGNLGDIMKESAKAALSYIRSRCDSLKIDPEFHKNKDIHIHFPEGGIPKDGPSAGITMATAIVSALTNIPIRRDVAMTGEITLRGRVLPIGGLKEKTMAAYRSGIKTVIVPADNEHDLKEIDQTVFAALNFVIADHMDAVLKTALVAE